MVKTLGDDEKDGEFTERRGKTSQVIFGHTLPLVIVALCLVCCTSPSAMTVKPTACKGYILIAL